MLKLRKATAQNIKSVCFIVGGGHLQYVKQQDPIYYSIAQSF